MRTNLASVILRMLSKNRRYHQVSLPEAPESRAVNDGFKLLEELNAIDGKKQPRRSANGQSAGRSKAGPDACGCECAGLSQ